MYPMPIYVKVFYKASGETVAESQPILISNGNEGFSFFFPEI